jgi:hypothetical protein
MCPSVFIDKKNGALSLRLRSIFVPGGLLSLSSLKTIACSGNYIIDIQRKKVFYSGPAAKHPDGNTARAFAVFYLMFLVKIMSLFTVE